MYNINYYGEYEKKLVPKIIRYLLDEDYDYAKEMLKNGFDINQKLILGDNGSEVSLLDVACAENDNGMFNFLIDNGFKIDSKYDKSLMLAARFCRPYLFAKRLMYLKEISYNEVEYLIEQICLHGNFFQNIYLLELKGMRISKYGGLAFVIGAWNGNKRVVKFLVRHGVNMNYQKPNMIFPDAPTALIAAIEGGHLKIAKYLVKKGTNVTLRNNNGKSAFDIAIKKGYIQLVNYMRKFEPEEYKLAREKEKSEFELPDSLVEFLKKSDKEREIIFSPNSCIKFMNFYSYDNMICFEYKKKKVIDLVTYLDGYSGPSFVFNLNNSKVYGIDIEHGTFVALAKWDKFYDNMEHYVNGFINGDFDRH